MIGIAVIASLSNSSSSSPTTVDATTCKGLIPDVIKVSTDNSTASGGVVLIAIYKPVLIADHVKAFDAGTFKIPAGANKVNILDCKGQGEASDSTTVPINYQLSVDTNGDQFVAFQVR